MLFGLADPLTLVRRSTESVLREQVPDTVLIRIATLGEPKFLTIGRNERRLFRREHVLVTHFGFSVKATLDVTSGGGSSHASPDSALTFLFGNIHKKGAEISRSYVDLDLDVQRVFTDEAFQKRFLELRLECDRGRAG